MDKSTVMKNYRFLALMLFAMVAGCVAGWFFPEFGHFIKPAGTVFINMMFCVVVPLVFASISNSVASVRSRKRAGKLMGTTVLTFVVTGAVAAVIMFIVMKLVPPVLEPWTDMATEAIGEHASLADMIVNFFTTSIWICGWASTAARTRSTEGESPCFTIISVSPCSSARVSPFRPARGCPRGTAMQWRYSPRGRKLQRSSS